MPSDPDWLVFAGAAFLMTLTPGPNMVYLISRALCQGRFAGLVSLLGVVAGFFVHMLGAALGLVAIVLTAPMVYQALKAIGSTYLLFLAWRALRQGDRSPVDTRGLSRLSTGRLFLFGLLTNLLNPGIVVFYLSVLPGFVSASRGSVVWQSLQLGLIQVGISFTVNLCIVMSAVRIADWSARQPSWLAVQKYVMALGLAVLAIWSLQLGPETQFT